MEILKRIFATLLERLLKKSVLLFSLFHFLYYISLNQFLNIMFVQSVFFFTKKINLIKETFEFQFKLFSVDTFVTQDLGINYFFSTLEIFLHFYEII